MAELSILNLEECFKSAKDNQFKFVGIRVQMAGFPSDEIIINDFLNFDAKLEYYKRAYNINLVLKSYDGIKIVGFTTGNSFKSIQKDLLG